MRVTEKNLTTAIHQLNKTLNLPPESQYELDIAYGGYKLTKRMMAGYRDVTSGYEPKREVYTFILGMFAGIRATKEN